MIFHSIPIFQSNGTLFMIVEDKKYFIFANQYEPNTQIHGIEDCNDKNRLLSMLLHCSYESVIVSMSYSMKLKVAQFVCATSKKRKNDYPILKPILYPKQFNHHKLELIN